MPRPTQTPFQALQNTAFGIVQQTMGYEASWTPALGGAAYTARVLFQNPTEMKKIAAIDYSPQDWVVEYKEGDFPGLMDAVITRSTNEVIEIQGTDYYVTDVSRKYDGQTYIAKLIPA